MKAQWSWRVLAMFLGVFLAAAAGWMVVPSVADAASCEGAPAPCAEDTALDNCTQCHSMGITGGNRNGTDRMITVSSASNRHILGPPMASWLSTVQGMIAKGGGGVAATIAAYLDTNYCPTCTGPIMSSATISDVASDQFTVSWTTSGNAFGDLAATSCVIYGTSLAEMTGDTCNPSDPSYDPNGSSFVTNHSVRVTGLSPLTQYFVVHRSTAGANTATYAGAATVTTFPGGGGGGGGALGIIASVTVGNYNADTHLDIGVGVSTKSHVLTFLGTGGPGSGAFTAGPTLTNVGTTPSAITSGGVEADFDEDGFDDLAVANFGEASQNVAIFLGTSPSGFETTPVAQIALADPPTGVATGDFNEDGNLDLAVATVQLDGLMGHLLIFMGAGTGQFPGAPAYTYNIEVAVAQGPQVTDIVPNTVDCTGLPTNITIMGSLLLSSATVTLDGVLPLPVVSGSPDNTSLVVSVPNTATAGTHSVVVSLGPSSGSGTLVINPRNVTVSSVSPASKVYGVDPAGQVTIIGTNFTLGAEVTIGSLNGVTVAGTFASATTPFVFVNSAAIRVWVGSTDLPAGTYDVTVENVDACGGSATLSNGFTMVAPQPNVASVSPSSVNYAITSSTSVSISGANFLAGAVVTVGDLTGTTVPGTTATSTNPFVFVNSGLLRFYWPNTSLPPGQYTVQVTNPVAAGGATGTLTNGFTVNAPQPNVVSVSPNTAIYGVTPSTALSISGTNFVLGATITIGSVSGTTVQGTTATASNPFVWVNTTTLRFYWSNTSQPSGSYSVTVQNPTAAGGQSGTLANGFVISDATATITSVSPATVTYAISPSQSVSIIGSNFVLGAGIAIQGAGGTWYLAGGTVQGSTASASTPFVYVNSGLLRFWWPNTSLPAGTYDVLVSNPAAAGGQISTLTGGFQVLAPTPAPVATSPSLVTYGVSASQQVSITGSNFVLGAGIAVGNNGGTWYLNGGTVQGSNASVSTPFVFVNSGLLRFWWPNNSLPPGTYDILVYNPAAAGGQSTLLPNAFQVSAPTPVITAASPATVTYAVSSSQQVSITGSNFVLGAGIAIGTDGGTWYLNGGTVQGSNASASTPFVFVNSGLLKFWWPNTSLPAGTYDILVYNPVHAGAQSTILHNAFQVSAPTPVITAATPATVTYNSTSQQITVTGSNFVLGAGIAVGNNGGTWYLNGGTVQGSNASASTPFVFVNSGQLKFWWPSTSLPPGTYDILVYNTVPAGGQSAIKTGGFTVSP
ncbi:MAG: FG-GAP-like repeat-containing protein [Nitrospirota bacterium]